MDAFLVRKEAFSGGPSCRDEELRLANKTLFGNDDFRPHQLEIVKAILDGHDVFVIMPTGGGKSLCYSLPAVLSQGITVVISPLISLIEDQVSALLNMRSCGGIPAAYLTSNCTEVQLRAVMADLQRGIRGTEPFLKLLYVTPEKIVKAIEMRQLLVALFQNNMLARFVIDECHCVSQWGHDFRKEYAMLDVLKEEFPEVPIVALTATARKKVADDTIRILRMTSCKKFFTGYDRPNLFFEVRQKPASTRETYQHLLQYLKSPENANATGIVYCMTKSECEQTALFLQQNEFKADFYHAGQTKTDRKMVQNAWLCGDVKVVCATIAYGMGIDKPDVRFVVHLSLAKSLEGYYQEAGRAGRDGKRSECIVFYRASDVNSLKRIMMQPPKRRLSAKDEAMLEEMEEYCINLSSCRRKLFFEKFSDPSDIQSRRATFKECGNMCDNCSSKRGGQRRTFNQGGGYQALPIDLSGGGGGGYGYSGAGAIAANSGYGASSSGSGGGAGRAGFTTASGRAVQVRGYNNNAVMEVDVGDDEKERGGRVDRWNSRGTGQIVVVDGAINVDSDDEAPSSSINRRGPSGQQAQAQKARIIPAKEMYLISERARKQDNGDDEHMITSNSSSSGKAANKQQQSQGSLNSFIVPKTSSISSSPSSSNTNISLVDGSSSRQILPPRPTDFSLSRSRGAVLPPRPKTTNSIINSGITGTAAATTGNSTGTLARKSGGRSDGSVSGSQSTRIMGSSYNGNADSMATLMLADEDVDDIPSVSSSRNGRDHSREHSRERSRATTTYGEEAEFEDAAADGGWVPPRQKKPRSND